PNYQYLHLFFMNKDCSSADTFVCLTPNGTLQFKASEFDPLTTGYLIAVAVDEQGRPTQNNSFIGSAFVRDDQAGVIDSYGAESFWKYSSGAAPANADGSATIYFDGVNYDQVPIQFSTPLQDPTRATQKLVLASLAGDLGTKLNATSQNLTGALYRDDETLASFTNALGSGCLIERSVTSSNFRVAPGTLAGFLKDRYGYLKFNLTSPAVGLIQNKQGAPAQYPNNRFAGIRSLHKTAVISSSLKLPIFHPFCQ
ncbi:MAG TPA: hypothetical protein VEF04_21370, partial [Blastocatellia bacterium]|nr:hypothetical protein [Blastocatellia bacterium]